MSGAEAQWPYFSVCIQLLGRAFRCRHHSSVRVQIVLQARLGVKEQKIKQGNKGTAKK